MMKICVLLLIASLPALPQFGDARSLQHQPIKPGMTCASDAYVLTWVAARSQFECLAASGGGGVTSVFGSTGVITTLANPAFTGTMTVGTSALGALGGLTPRLYVSGDGNTTFADLAQVVAGESFATRYFFASDGTLAAPLDSFDQDILGQEQACYYHNGGYVCSEAVGYVVDNVVTGAKHIQLGAGGWNVALPVNSALPFATTLSPDATTVNISPGKITYIGSLLPNAGAVTPATSFKLQQLVIAAVDQSAFPTLTTTASAIYMFGSLTVSIEGATGTGCSGLNGVHAFVYDDTHNITLTDYDSTGCTYTPNSGTLGKNSSPASGLIYLFLQPNTGRTDVLTSVLDGFIVRCPTDLTGCNNRITSHQLDYSTYQAEWGWPVLATATVASDGTFATLVDQRAGIYGTGLGSGTWVALTSVIPSAGSAGTTVDIPSNRILGAQNQLLTATSGTENHLISYDAFSSGHDSGIDIANVATTGAAGGKHVVCIDHATKQLYESSTGTDCSN